MQDACVQHEKTSADLRSQLEEFTKPETAEPIAAEEGSLEARIENYRNQVLTLRKQLKEREDSVTEFKSKN